MTLDDFRIATELMFQAFTPIKPTDRLRALYEFFKHEKPDDIRSTARSISIEHERFPTIQAFGFSLKSIKERRERNNPSPKIACKWCYGDGRVCAIDEKGYSWSYRCNRDNASSFKNYPPWFGEKHTGKTLLNSLAGPEPMEEIAKAKAIFTGIPKEPSQ